MRSPSGRHASAPRRGEVAGQTSEGADVSGHAGGSRICAQCGHIDKANRASQARFVCRSCRFVAHADWNGSRNIRHRAEELWRSGAQSSAPDPPPDTGRGTGRKRSTTASGARCASPGLLVPGG
ncbi:MULTISPECIES: zinc ribbon domain-containing protein [unclassified Streptomyces]|uniref:zinc ribbon domain-containing protein n=1 Tax=unclassified Streptomyces TaxID=2593676 RepID=UPI00379A8AB2